MAVSQIEEKILGRLARQTEFTNPLLSASLYQVLGLSILLSKKLYRARKLRKLDITRDTKSLQLYHHIIWLAREGLSITEVYILPYCQDGEQGPECRVMAAKLRASLYHVFCLFHNHPPVSQLSARSAEAESTPSSSLSPRDPVNQSRRSPRKSPKAGRSSSDGQRRAGKSALRDAIPSMTSETSYVTNPYAAGPAQTPPPPGRPPPIPTDARRTPTRPPGLTPINVSATQAAASFLLPPLNFVPMAREHFETAQYLANNLLSAAHALRLSVALEHAAFLWDCDKSHDRARRLARKAIKEVYASTEGLDDDEFADASTLVQSLGGIVRRGSEDPTPRPSQSQLNTGSPIQRPSRTPPHIDRTIAVSPQSSKRPRTGSPAQSIGTAIRSPERLSTVLEETSSRPLTSTSTEPTTQTALSPPVSRMSNRSRPRRTSSSTSDKASKRRAVEQAEELYRQNSQGRPSRRGSGGDGGGGGTQSSSGHSSRQATPPDGSPTGRAQSKHAVRRRRRRPPDTDKGGSSSSSGGSNKKKKKSSPPTPPPKPSPPKTSATSPPRSRRKENQRAVPYSPPRSSPQAAPREQQQAPPPPPKPQTSPSPPPATGEPRFEPMYRHSQTRRSHRAERREAILRTLEIISAVRFGLRAPRAPRAPAVRSREREQRNTNPPAPPPVNTTAEQRRNAGWTRRRGTVEQQQQQGRNTERTSGRERAARHGFSRWRLW